MIKSLIFLPFISRVFLAVIFIIAGVRKAMNFDGTAQYIASKGLPVPDVLAGATIAVEVLGGVALVVGFLTRLSSFGLAIFCLLTIYFFHNFWALPAAEAMAQQTQAVKNLAIAGGLLLLTYWGAGPLSVDRND